MEVVAIFSNMILKYISLTFFFVNSHMDQPNICHFQPLYPIYAKRPAFRYTIASSPVTKTMTRNVKKVLIFKVPHLLCTTRQKIAGIETDANGTQRAGQRTVIDPRICKIHKCPHQNHHND